MRTILKRPLITEGATQKANQGHFTFAVGRGATKQQIKEAVERLFKVTVLEVRTLNIPGKSKRNTRGFWREAPPTKKAIVTLKKGEKIDLFETTN